MRLNGKVALITGGGSGVGAAPGVSNTVPNFALPLCHGLSGLLFSPARPNRPEYHIRWLSVAERSRRLGVGSALVWRVFGLVPLGATLSVVTFGEDIEAGRAARRFYERMGFHAVEAAPNGSEGGSRQVYRRELSLHRER